MPLTHIRQGDVVFTVDATGTLMHRVISTAQVLGASSGHRSSVHAAIATGAGFEVYKSVGSGLKKFSAASQARPRPPAWSSWRSPIHTRKSVRAILRAC